jgi:myosin heavy subunit
LQRAKSGFILSTVGARFRRQLQGLMSTLAECNPNYIRCVKPNPESRPGNMVPEHVLEQLRAGGVLEAVRIACAGFPSRKPFLPFAQRYSLLLGGRDTSLNRTANGCGVDWRSMSDKDVSMCGWQMGWWVERKRG